MKDEKESKDPVSRALMAIVRMMEARERNAGAKRNKAEDEKESQIADLVAEMAGKD